MPKIFIPFVGKNASNVRKTVNIGIDGTGISSNSDRDRFLNTGINVSVVGGFPLRDMIQSNQALDLGKCPKINRVSQSLAGKGLTLMANLHGAPDFMKRSTAGPLHPNYFDKYAEICATITQIYKEITQFQIWNEPDFDTGMPGVYGCWGSTYVSDYVLLLAKCKKAIKVVRPDVKITVGLGMTDDKSLNFLRCLKQAGGLVLIDYLNFHHYGYYDGKPIKDASWLTNDPLHGIAMKIDYIGRYTDNLPLQLTETNLLYDSPNTPVYEAAKAAFILHTTIVAAQKGIESVIAYAWESNWRNANIRGQDAEDAIKLLAKIYSVV